MPLCARCKVNPQMKTRSYCRDCWNIKQREHATIQGNSKKRYQANLEENRAKSRARYQNDPVEAEKKHVRNKARNFVKTGICSKCGAVGETQWHHPDYTKPDMVVELCTICHAKEH